MRIMHDDGDYSEVDLEVEHPKDHAATPLMWRFLQEVPGAKTPGQPSS